MASFHDGFNAFVRLNGASLGAEHGAKYVGSIEAEIDKLANAINNPARKIDNASLDSVKGFMAEYWAAGTHNIDAAVKGVSARAVAIDDNRIADITTSWGEELQSKINKDPSNTVRELSITNRGHHNRLNQTEYSGDDPNALYYEGMSGLVATDKMDAIQTELRRKVLENKEIRPEISENYQQVLNSLTDKVRSNQGSESIPITEKEARELARLAKEKGFDPSDWGIATEYRVNLDNIMNQAFKAGLTAALISVVLRVGPQICGMICRLIKDGEVNVDDLKRLGFSAFTGGTEGLIRGLIAAAVTVSCKSGIFGAVLKKANPSMIGAVVAISMNCVQNSCLLAFGKMSKREYANRCAQDMIVTAFSVGLGFAGGVVASTMFTPAMAVFGYMMGSFVGSVIGTFVYSGVYSCFMAFCVESGCTFFGLVEQKYEIPPDVIDSMGLDVFEYEKFEVKKFFPESFQAKKFGYERFEPIGIDIKYLRRGVIGVGIVGYIDK